MGTFRYVYVLISYAELSGYQVHSAYSSKVKADQALSSFSLSDPRYVWTCQRLKVL